MTKEYLIERVLIERGFRSYIDYIRNQITKLINSKDVSIMIELESDLTDIDLQLIFEYIKSQELYYSHINQNEIQISIIPIQNKGDI